MENLRKDQLDLLAKLMTQKYGIYDVIFRHENDCQIFNNLTCSCKADITIKPISLRTEKEPIIAV